LAADHARLLAVCADAARRAAAAIMAVYAADFGVRRKDDASPVTLADERAEAIILEALCAAAPEIPVIAEEKAAAHGLPEAAPRRFFLVDPLDGTKEFISRNGEFTVNIALVEDGIPVLGVVHVPAQDVTYVGAEGRATRRRGDAPAEPIRARPPPSGLVVVHSRSHENNAALAAYLSDKRVAEMRVSGSSVKFCLLAAGEADLYPRFGETMEWDTAAGHAVLLAAGGSVVTHDGAPLGYGKPGFRNSGFVAHGLAPRSPLPSGRG
jgi:3'(2'), 5'-bisphosphate nucleotidase